MAGASLLSVVAAAARRASGAESSPALPQLEGAWSPRRTSLLAKAPKVERAGSAGPMPPSPRNRCLPEIRAGGRLFTPAGRQPQARRSAPSWTPLKMAAESSLDATLGGGVPVGSPAAPRQCLAAGPPGLSSAELDAGFEEIFATWPSQGEDAAAGAAPEPVAEVELRRRRACQQEASQHRPVTEDRIVTELDRDATARSLQSLTEGSLPAGSGTSPRKPPGRASITTASAFIDKVGEIEETIDRVQSKIRAVEMSLGTGDTEFDEELTLEMERRAAFIRCMRYRGQRN